jgi:hypothetical protein
MSADVVPIRAFPQIKYRSQLGSDFLRAICARALNNELCFRYINRDFSRAIAEVDLPPLPLAGERVVEDLRAHGVAFADFSEFFDASLYGKIIAAFNSYRDAFLKEREARGGKMKGKELIIDTIHKSHHFVPNDPVSEYLSAPVVAAIAARYMGMVPRYVGSSFWHTKPAPSDERLYSQQWHRDYNDRRLVKFFLHLSDVGPENGYFEYVTGTHALGSLGKAFDRIGSDGYRAYPDQNAVDETFAEAAVFDLAKLPPEQRVGKGAPWNKGAHCRILATAKAGAMIFCDTFGIHRGGFVKSGHRDLVMGTYSTNYNIHKPHFSVSPEFATGLSPFMRLAFGIK